MLVLVTGGAASGKSAVAERICMELGGPLCYVATMQVWDEEDRARVRRHRALRAGKGFSTVECPVALEEAQVPLGSTVLLECLTTLAANEMFSPQGAGDGTLPAIRRGIAHLTGICRHVVVVTGELSSDGGEYPEETTAYLECMAQLNRELAQQAQQVYEVVCGIPLCRKDEVR
ncbi:MAG: bifunctional adenosylcobinamide kinase/adenosylcobinamide-phosphate guanylyltransferase [Eubacteriales bacterium]|jgi:adenosylcobinamide kinase/adenosylcobinamide-phosphate guanylyltransferase